MEYINLSELIELFEQKSKSHICIHDVRGVLTREPLIIPAKNKIHSCGFCDAAKSTQKGYDMCIRCKTAANKKAVFSKNSFSGYCPYGLYEIVRPVVVNGAAVCIIYIGNLVFSESVSAGKIKKTSAITGVREERLLAELKNAEFTESIDYYSNEARVLDSYIRLIINSDSFSKSADITGRCGWKVKELLRNIEENYDKNISVSQMADLYFVNRKYLGRVFKRSVGMSFSEYLNSVRLKKAAQFLADTDKTVLSIALDCGFQNVTYFNRLFLAKYHLTPTQYRKNLENTDKSARIF